MLYARTPQQGNGRVERATAQSTTVPQTVLMHEVGPIVCQETHQHQHQQQTKAP